ncbi:hypothetical protein TELCIR_25786, partial [Teladorsagia circumcincta]
YCLLLKKELPPTRLTTTSWCLCGSCISFTSVRENVCCREALEGEGGARPSQALEGLQTLEIIMGHVKFALKKGNEPLQDDNKQVLIYTTFDYAPYRSISRRLRYCAYRSFVFWCYGHLGLGKRYELPACVRGAIMKAFPSTTGVYAGFKGADGRYASIDCDDEDWRESAL